MKEDKEYEKLKDGRLKIIITTEQDLMLPGNINVGSLYQKTEQYFDADKVETFKNFVSGQKSKCEEEIKKQESIISRLHNIKVDVIPEKMLGDINKYLNKSSKTLKTKMITLNNYIARMSEKSNALSQLEYLKKQLKIIDKDLESINKK